MLKRTLVAIAVAICAPGVVQANFTSVTGATLTYQGNVTYSDTLGSPIVTATGSIISQTISTMGSSSFSGVYDSTFGFPPNGLRVTDVLNNQSGQAWSSITLNFGGSPGIYFTGDAYSPGIVTNLFPQSGTPTVMFLTAYHNGSNGGMVVESADHLSLTFKFLAPVLSGSTVALHVPLINLATAGGTLSMSLTPNSVPVPEPSGLVLMGMGLVGLIGFGLGRRRSRE